MRIINKIKPYSLTSQKVFKIKNKKKIIKLDWNEFAYDLPLKIKKKITNYILQEKLNWYPNVYPEELIKEIAEYCGISSRNLIHFSGSDSALDTICKAVIFPNDKVLIFTPNYDQFRLEAKINRAKLFFLNVNNEKDINYKKIKKINPKIIYFSNPNNPLGYFINKNKIEKLIKDFRNIFFIIDEAYIEYSNSKTFLNSQIIKKYENFIVTRTFSKAFGLASLRLGYCISNKNLLDQLNVIKNHKSINIISILAGILVLKNKKYFEKKIQSIKKNKERLLNFFDKFDLNIKKTDTNFITIKSKKRKKLISYLNKNNIFVRDLNHIKNLKNFIRITIGTRKQTEILIRFLRKFYNKYNTI